MTVKSAQTIAGALLEHCLWYFVRPGGAPSIQINDDCEVLPVEEVYEDYKLSEAKSETVVIKTEKFELTHIKLKASSNKDHFIAWCAARRLVKEEKISGKLPGLYGTLRQGDAEFVYACYVSSPFLDQHVRPDRSDFLTSLHEEDLLADGDLSIKDIQASVLESTRDYLGPYLLQNQEASQARITTFVEHKAPRYRPILKRIGPDKLNVSPDVSDRELELHLHKQLVEIEGSLIADGQNLMNFGVGESYEQYRKRLNDYLGKVANIKKSDLANYVFHRKVVLDILSKSVMRGANGKYAREDLIHELIIPMRQTTDDILSDKANLWLIDERLAFHNFLASDRTLISLPITASLETKEPDIVALNIFDEPLFIADADKLPLATITVVEIKRPMRDDSQSGEEKNAIEQALGYLERIRNGNALTAKGRPIPGSTDIPGYCYVLCDITSSVQRQCKILNLRVTADKMGYFGYNDNYKAYIEVISFDRLVNSATERNRAFFDKLGLPN